MRKGKAVLQIKAKGLWKPGYKNTAKNEKETWVKLQKQLKTKKAKLRPRQGRI